MIDLAQIEKFVPAYLLPEDKDDMRQEIALFLLENPAVIARTVKEFVREKLSSKSSYSKATVGLTIITNEGEEVERTLPMDVIPKVRKQRGRQRKDGRAILRDDGRKRHGIIASLTTMQLQEWAALFNAGEMSMKDIANAAGISERAIYGPLKTEMVRRGIRLNIRPKPHRISQQLANKAVDLYQKGLSHRQVGKVLGISSTAAAQFIKQSDVPIRPVGHHGAKTCRHKNCARSIFKQTRTYFDKRINREVTTTFGSTCRFHYLLEAGERSRKSWEKHHVRVRGGEKCFNGHPYTEVNTYWYKSTRYCRTCRRNNHKRYIKRRGPKKTLGGN